MVTVLFDPSFQKLFSKIRDPAVKERVIKMISKLKDAPDLGKPMMYARQGTRELYIPPFRLSYLFLKEEEKVILLDLYHKDEQ